jgi:hypothetical protein
MFIQIVVLSVAASFSANSVTNVSREQIASTVNP